MSRSLTRRVGVRAGVALLLLSTVTACQNWDLLEPPAADEERSFTRLDDAEDAPLTNAVALTRLDAIEAAEGEHRLELVEAFLADFSEARLIPQVHRAAGEAHLAAGRPGDAADAFERALVVTRTDLLGLPLETELPLQLALSSLAAGDRERGLEWLGRTILAEQAGAVDQAAAWAHAELTPGVGLEPWKRTLRDAVAAPAPRFDLPGFQSPGVAAPDPSSRATLINFWSPT